MAINYLNTVDLNKNQLNNAAIQNLSSNPATGVLGQIYYNTTDSVLKICVTASTLTPTNAVWAEVGGGVETLTTTNGSYINLTPTSATAGAVTVTADLSAIDGTAVAATRFLSKDNTWDVPAYTTNTNTTYTLPVSAGGTNDAVITLTAGGSGGGGGTVTFSGTTDQIAVTEIPQNNGTIIIGLPDNVVVASDLEVGGDLTVSGEAFFNGSGFEINASTNIDFGNNKITNVTDPTAAQDAATKNYVDSSNLGQLIYQGGYNAYSNTPNLDTSSNIVMKRGFTYTVTMDGLFFTEQVRAGDVIIANLDIPANSSTNSLLNFTTVQQNVDLASLTVIGIGNVIADTAGAYDGLRVTYSAGTATVGLDINSLPTETLNYGASDILIPYVNDTDGEQRKASLDDLVLTANGATSKKGTIPVGDLFGTVTVPSTWGFDTMVQTRNAAGDTVFCDVTRTSTSVTATISATQATVITILVQKIG